MTARTGPIDLGARGLWRRDVFATGWYAADDDLTEFLRPHVEAHRPDEGDAESFVIVTEKVVSLAAGLSIDVADLRVGRLARFLAQRVRPRGNSLALSVPEKMQWVIDEIGVARTVLAAVASAVTRPFGHDGAFYAIAGTKARSVDGVRGAYPSTLLPPLSKELGRRWCEQLSTAWGRPVAIIDMNDRGGSVRATSAGLDIDLVTALTADNPLGSSRDGTPVGVVTRVSA